MAKIPDSEVSPDETTEVIPTPEYDNPQFGAFTIRHQKTKNSANVLRLSRRSAKNLMNQLREALEEG